MSAGKGPRVAQGYRTKQYENSKLWENLKKGKTEKELKKRLLAEGGIDILTGLKDDEK
jgi:hypothetical protein